MKTDAPHTLGFQLTLAARLHRTRLARALQAIGLFPGQEQVLTALGPAPEGLTMGELAKRLHVRPPTLTKTIQRLQTHQLIARRAKENDARVVLLALTEAGRDKLALVAEAEAALEAELSALFKPKAEARLHKGLKRLARHLAASTAATPLSAEDDDGSSDDEE